MAMKQTFLDFEQPIAELEAKIDELRYVHEDSAVDISDEIGRLQKKSQQLTKEIYGKLTAVADRAGRAPPAAPVHARLHQRLFSDFVELHGDRSYADDPAIVGGLARFDGQPCMVIGQQKGRDTKEKIHRNFGMPRSRGLPQGAAADAAGREVRPAGPHLHRHARRLSRASAPRSAASPRRSRATSTRWPACACRSSCTVIGEGGSGGALAIAVGDVTLMLAVRDLFGDLPRRLRLDPVEDRAEQAPEAAETLGITAPRLKQLGLIDKVITEPLGGAHRDPAAMMVTLKKALTEALRSLQEQPLDTLLETREDKILSFGKFKEIPAG